METSPPTPTSKCFPLEIESNILSRLPIKDRIRYQCVCKRWRDEIKNPKFIKSHTFHVVKFNHTNSRDSVILFSRSSAKLYSLDFHSPENVKKVIRLSHSFDYDTRLVGSCNGLLCFFKLTGWFLFYNPAIQACKTVCVSPSGIKYRMGFGYDCTSDDYKILQTETVNTARYDGQPKQVESHVYSLRNNSWKVVQKPLTIYLSTCLNRMILSNNVLHWIDYKPRNNMTTGFIMSKIITCFDLGMEEYHELPLPKDDNDDGVIISELADSKGYLHLVKYRMNRSSLHKMEIWIMKEYGVEQTWSKLVSIKLDHIIADIVGRQVHSSKPFLPLLLAYSEDGQEILVDLGQYSKDGMIFVQCDMRSGGFKRLEIQVCDLAADFRDGYVVMPWVGSFVSPSM